jgi:GT2 family glycosyltransferase
MTLPPPLPRSCSLTSFGQTSGWDCAIVIPAKDEEQRIGACLTAAGTACCQTGNGAAGIIVVVNNTIDTTASCISDWAMVHPDIPLVVVDCIFDAADAGVGSARRLGLDLGCRMVGADGALLTSDADTLVRSDWITQNLSELEHADLICGTVLGQPDEVRALPPEIAGHGSAEWDYVNGCIALAAALDPQPHDPAPAHHNAAGASLAVSAQVYEAVGGLPVIQMGEDRALAERIEAHDFKVRYSNLAVVETSCRMEGRTDGGMAGALRARAFEDDPFADEWLEPTAAFALRYRLRGVLRAVWPNETDLRRVLSECLNPATADRLLARPRPRFSGAFIAEAEKVLPRTRLRLSDCKRELPLLQALIAECHASRMQHEPSHPTQFRTAAE